MTACADPRIRLIDRRRACRMVVDTVDDVAPVGFGIEAVELRMLDGGVDRGGRFHPICSTEKRFLFMLNLLIDQQWLKSAIKIMIGIGTPRRKSKIERMVKPP
jgi:hypothetical protein